MRDTENVGLEEIVALLRALDEHEVSYAIFGGVALGLHGLARATADLDLFIEPDRENVERLKRALRAVYEDSSIAEISAEELCGDYPAVRYYPPRGFGLDILTRIGDAVTWDMLEIVEIEVHGILARVVSPRTLWLMKKDTVRPIDRVDAQLLADRFGLSEEQE